MTTLASFMSVTKFYSKQIGKFFFCNQLIREREREIEKKRKERKLLEIRPDLVLIDNVKDFIKLNLFKSRLS